jgi:serine/threonine-protein kinase
MVIVLALAFFLSAIVTIYTLFRSGDTQVPNLIGKTEIEAQKLAEQAGLRVKVQHRNDPTVPGNSVIETRPGPNSSVKKDSVLTLVVSSGPVSTSGRLLQSNPSSPGRRAEIRRMIVDTLKSLVGP